MRTVQEAAMPDTFSSSRAVQTVNEIGERVVAWSPLISSAPCRLARSTVLAQRTSMSQQNVVIGSWRLTVAVGTDIRGGDRVTVNGAQYEVVDVASGPHWETARRCELKELDSG